MGALRQVRAVLAAGLLLCSTSLRADPVARWTGDIAEASVRFGIDQSWVEAVMHAESGGHTVWQGRPITSHAGAMGLMQLMPGTWADMRRRYGLGSDPHDPHDNITAGTAYLAAMHARFGYPGLFGAYHAGPARYADYVAGRRSLPPETRAYMTVVTANLGTPMAVPSMPVKAEKPPSLFIYRAQNPAPETAEIRGERAPKADPLFAVRRAF
ncbi:MAG TPA: lytic transglycosylase domain-containing protein [Sphingobium sp.]|nr:lytic transglycosylase domain-containing protein [Sphingobium sp.]